MNHTNGKVYPSLHPTENFSTGLFFTSVNPNTSSNSSVLLSLSFLLVRTRPQKIQGFLPGLVPGKKKNPAEQNQIICGCFYFVRYFMSQ